MNPTIDLNPADYRQTGSVPIVIRRGWRRGLYFLRHPILAFVSYQIVYADTPEQAQAFRERQAQAFSFGLGTYLMRLFIGQ